MENNQTQSSSNLLQLGQQDSQPINKQQSIGANFIDSSVSDINSEKQSQIKKSSSFFKILSLIFFGVLMVVFGFFVFKRLYNSTEIIDVNNGFKFSSIVGWKKISSREGSYLSLATISEDQFIISYADIRIIPNDMPEKFIGRMLSEDKTNEISEMCQNNSKEVGTKFLGIEKLSIPGTNSYKCMSEGVGDNTNGNILLMDQIVIIKPENNIIISTSYQKNLQEEKIKVDNLISGFEIIK
jgi:hypothetical protein